MAAKILVVEDNEDSRLILLLMLKHFGYEAIGAATGPLGVERANWVGRFEDDNSLTGHVALRSFRGVR